MSNIRLFFLKSLSLNLTAKLDKSQSHYVNKVMRIKVNETFSLFNIGGEWEAKIIDISKNIEAPEESRYTDVILIPGIL